MAQNDMGNAALITWAKFGVEFIKTTKDSNGFVFYISVPEHSYERDANSVEMAGMHLASRFKQSLNDLKVPATVKSKTRVGTFWSKDDANKAELKMRVKLLLSDSRR